MNRFGIGRSIIHILIVTCFCLSTSCKEQQTAAFYITEDNDYHSVIITLNIDSQAAKQLKQELQSISKNAEEIRGPLQYTKNAYSGYAFTGIDENGNVLIHHPLLKASPLALEYNITAKGVDANSGIVRFYSPSGELLRVFSLEPYLKEKDKKLITELIEAKSLNVPRFLETEKIYTHY